MTSAATVTAKRSASTFLANVLLRCLPSGSRYRTSYRGPASVVRLTMLGISRLLSAGASGWQESAHSRLLYAPGRSAFAVVQELADGISRRIVDVCPVHLGDPPKLSVWRS